MLLLILSVSCVLEEPDVMESNLHNPEIYKAKNWFEAQDFNAQSHKNQNSSSSRKDMPYLEKRPDWNLTKQHTNAAGQEVLEISLKFERSMISKYMLEKFKNKKPRPHQISQNMLMVAKENGEYDIFILKIHSETDLSVNNRKDFFQKMNYGTVSKDFSGEMIISTIDQVPIKGWKVQEGKKLSKFKIIHDSGPKNLSTANFSSTCGFSKEDHCVVTSGWFYDEEFGWDYGSEISCTTFTHLECIDEDNDSQNPAKDDDDPLGPTGLVGEAENDDCITSQEDLKKAFPNAPDPFLKELEEYINKHGKDFGIDSKEKMQHLLSQAAHESKNYKGDLFAAFEENLNYRWKKLGTPKNFENWFNTIENPTADPTKANPYDFKRSSTSDYVDSEKLANYVYNRSYLGNINPGDGYKYRGRGIFQLTGKDNYSKFNNFYRQNYNSNFDLVKNPELVSSNTEIAVISALWYFKNRVLKNVNIDVKTTVETVTEEVNGGQNGIKDRKFQFSKALEFIKCL